MYTSRKHKFKLAINMHDTKMIYIQSTHDILILGEICTGDRGININM